MSTDISFPVQGHESQISGFISIASAPIINVGDATMVDLPDMEGQIVDNYTDPDNVTRTPFNVAAQTITIAGINTRLATYIAINSVGAVVQFNTVMTPQQIRENALLSVVFHDIPNNNLEFIVNTPKIINSTGYLLRDYVLSEFQVHVGGNIIPNSAGNLEITKEAEELIYPGINAENNLADPNTLSVPQVNTVTFDVILADGSVDLDNQTDVPLLNFESGGLGVVSAISGGNDRCTINYIRKGVKGTVLIQRGQNEYRNINEALDAVATDLATVVADPVLTELFPISGVIIARKTATDLTLTGIDAFIINATGGRGSIGSPADTEADYVGNIFVNQSNGNDANDGRTIFKAIETLPAALTAAIALGPTVFNRVAIVITDAATYTLISNTTIPEGVDLRGPNASIITDAFRLNIDGDATVELREMSGGASGTDVVRHIQSGQGSLKLYKLTTLDPASTGVNMTAGSLNVKVDWMDNTGFGFIVSAGSLILDVGNIEMKTAATAAIFNSGGLVIGRIGAISSTIAGTEGIANISAGANTFIHVDTILLSTGVAVRATAGLTTIYSNGILLGAIVEGGFLDIQGQLENSAVQKIFVDTATGNDTFNGDSRRRPVKTLARARVLAVALTPAADNRITIHILDSASYDPEIAVWPEFVDIYGPTAIIDIPSTGATMTIGSSVLEIKEFKSDMATTGMILSSTAGSEVNIKRYTYTGGGDAVLHNAASGNMVFSVLGILCAGGNAIVSTNTLGGEFFVDIGAIIGGKVGGNLVSVETASAKIDGNIGSIFSTVDTIGISISNATATARLNMINIDIPSGDALSITAGFLSLVLTGQFNGTVIEGGIIRITGQPKSRARGFAVGNALATTINTIGVLEDINENVGVTLGTLNEFTHLGGNEFRYDGKYTKEFQVVIVATMLQTTNATVDLRGQLVVNGAVLASYPFTKTRETNQQTYQTGTNLANDIVLSPLDTIKIQVANDVDTSNIIVIDHDLIISE